MPYGGRMPNTLQCMGILIRQYAYILGSLLFKIFNASALALLCGHCILSIGFLDTAKRRLFPFVVIFWPHRFLCWHKDKSNSRGSETKYIFFLFHRNNVQWSVPRGQFLNNLKAKSQRIYGKGPVCVRLRLRANTPRPAELLAPAHTATVWIRYRTHPHTETVS